MDVWHMLGASASVLILALAVLVVRYGHVRFPYGRGEEKNSERRCKKTLDGVLLSGCKARLQGAVTNAGEKPALV